LVLAIRRPAQQTELRLGLGPLLRAHLHLLLNRHEFLLLPLATQGQSGPVDAPMGLISSVRENEGRRATRHLPNLDMINIGTGRDGMEGFRRYPPIKSALLKIGTFWEQLIIGNKSAQNIRALILPPVRHGQAINKHPVDRDWLRPKNIFWTIWKT
jgi:hypothetical protein